MSSVNKCILVGRLGKDPETLFAKSGAPICKFSLATSEKFKRNDEMEEVTTWHNIVAFGKTAETCQKYLVKGKLIYVEGRINNRSWEDDNGNKKYMTEIAIHSMQMLGNKGDSGEATPPSTPAQNDDQDIPF